MGERGPLRLPAHLQVVPAGPDAGQAPSAAGRVKPTAPVKPDGLPDAVSEAWDAIVPALDEAGLLAGCDGPALELALRHFVVAQKASAELLGARSRAAVKDPHHDGRLAKNPASQVFRDHSMAFLEFAKQLGLTFVARARTPVKEGDDGSSPTNPFAGG